MRITMGPSPHVPIMTPDDFSTTVDINPLFGARLGQDESTAIVRPPYPYASMGLRILGVGGVTAVGFAAYKKYDSALAAGLAAGIGTAVASSALWFWLTRK